MPPTTNKKIILTGTPFAWIHKIAAGVLTELWMFNNLQSTTYKLPKSSTSSTSSDNIDINRADAAIWRYPKFNLVLSGIDETDITPAGASNDATGLGDITVVTNEAPIESNSWTAYIREVKENRDSLFLVTIGTGFSYEGRVNTSLRKPDGFIHMIGKISNDIDQQLNNSPSTLTMEFISYKNSGLVEADLTSEDVFTEITWKLGGAGKDVSGIKPPAITADDAADLLNGDILVIPNIVYS